MSSVTRMNDNVVLCLLDVKIENCPSGEHMWMVIIILIIKLFKYFIEEVFKIMS